MINPRILCAAAIAAVLLANSQNTSAQIAEFDLENGIHLIVNPVSEAKDVGVETIYQVGFIDEPAGMVQASHLLEHLVCYSPGAGFETREAMNWLNDVGMANAETLPDMTHYDYAAPAEHLEKILMIEAARLQQTSFDPAIIASEAERVYQETHWVEKSPLAGMAKHAFMALSHVWRHQSTEALVRGGLDEMDPEQLLNFYRQQYRPSQPDDCNFWQDDCRRRQNACRKILRRNPFGRRS